MPSRFDGDAYINGNLRAKSMTIPAGAVDENSLNDNVLAHHRVPYYQNGAAASETVVVHTVHGTTGEVIAFKAGCQVKAIGDSTVTFDLQKSTGGGAFATVLSAVITLDSSSVNFVPETATILTSGIEDLVDDDVLRIVVTSTPGTGTPPTGVFASLKVKEARS